MSPFTLSNLTGPPTNVKMRNNALLTMQIYITTIIRTMVLNIWQFWCSWFYFTRSWANIGWEHVLINKSARPIHTRGCHSRVRGPRRRPRSQLIVSAARRSHHRFYWFRMRVLCRTFAVSFPTPIIATRAPQQLQYI